jgi:DNA polymerase-1
LVVVARHKIAEVTEVTTATEVSSNEGIGLMAKAMLSSWSCKPRKEPTTLYLHLVATGGPIPRSARLVLISIAGDYGQALLAPELLSELVPLLENPACRVVGHNLLFGLGAIRACTDRRLSFSNLWDTMIAWQMLNNGLPGKDASLQAVSRELIGRHLDESPKDKEPNRHGLNDEPSARQLEHATKASAILEPVYARQKYLIEKLGLMRVAALEFAAIPALAEIEHNGMGFNREEGLRLTEAFAGEKDELTRELQSYARSVGLKNFNPRNPAQVKKILHILGYNVENTSGAILEKIVHEHPEERFINLLMKYRELHLQQALLKNWLDFSEDGRIYPRLEQLGGRSGRITCSRPNIQQVPRDPKLKGLFAASPGMSLVEADFSAIEMRLLAVLSEDEVMLKIFKKGLDPHKQTAQAIFQKSNISSEERQIAKTLNYGTIYGGGANMVLSQLAYLTEEEAREFLYRFYSTYPGLKGWQRDVSEGAPVKVIDGEVYKISRSALGRIRYVNPDHRNALINTPIQATGSDLQKIALGRLYRELATPRYSEFKLVNAVHDSILLEVPDKRTGEATRLLQGVMEQAGNEILQVIPCSTDVKVGKDWSFKKDKHRFGLGAIFHGAASIGQRIFGHG